MPNLKNAKKALRQSKKRAAKNLKSKVEFKDLRKQTVKAIKAGDAKAQELLKATGKKLDKIAKSGYFTKNKVARLKSRLAKKVNNAGKSEVKKEVKKVAEKIEKKVE